MKAFLRSSGSDNLIYLMLLKENEVYFYLIS